LVIMHPLLHSPRNGGERCVPELAAVVIGGVDRGGDSAAPI